MKYPFSSVKFNPELKYWSYFVSRDQENMIYRYIYIDRYIDNLVKHSYLQEYSTNSSLVHHTFSSESCFTLLAWLMMSTDALRRESLSSLFCRSIRSTGALLLSPAWTTSAPAGTFCALDWGSEQRWTSSQDSHKNQYSENRIRTADHSDAVKHFVLL